MLTIDQVTPGDASAGTQEYGFQLGVKPGTLPFTAHTKVVSPWAGETSHPGQYIGLQVGPGTQSNYVEVALTGDSGGGLEVIAGSAAS